MKIDRKKILEIIKEEIQSLEEINPAHNKDGTFAAKGRGATYSLTKNALDDVGEDSELDVPARGRITSKGKISAKYGMNTSKPDKQCGRLTIDGDDKKKTRSCKDYPNNYWNEEQEQAPNKNKRDLVARAEDSDSIRKDKLFGDEELRRLANGIAEDEESLPRWDSEGRLINPAEDDGYIRIKKSELRRLLAQEEEEIKALEEGTTSERAAAYCRKLGFRTFADFLKTLDSVKKAESGELFGDGQ